MIRIGLQKFDKITPETIVESIGMIYVPWAVLGYELIKQGIKFNKEFNKTMEELNEFYEGFGEDTAQDTTYNEVEIRRQLLKNQENLNRFTSNEG